MMNRSVFRSAAFAALFALATATAASAGTGSHESITLDRDAVVGGKLLAAGSYSLELPSDEGIARFVQGRRTLAEVPCTVSPARVAYEGNAVHYRTLGAGHEQLSKIVFAKTKLAVSFPAESAATSAGSSGNAANRP